MLERADYPPERLEVIVVDNASEDGSAAMVEEEFPQVRVIRRSENVGVSGWDDGFAEARGGLGRGAHADCSLPADGLSRAVDAAERNDAALVSFSVVSSFDP